MAEHWITTDTHFNHKKLTTYYKERPPGYEEQILHNLWVVKSSDVLIHLGDVCIGDDENQNRRFLEASAAKTNVLVRGNHDKKSDSWYLDVGWSLVVKEMWIKKYGFHIVFSHEPLEGIAFENIRNIHGHTHGNAHRDMEHREYYSKEHHIEIALERTQMMPVKLTDKLVRG